ncbi:MAG: NUDIX hydrolase [Candidatus Uhrbacteria bacterium]
MEIIRPKSKQPIPDHAKKVFTGVMFDVYQWEQELFDGSKTIFEKVKRPDTVVVFPVLDDGRIILSEQEQPNTEPFISTASGQIDAGETVEEAARRELLEESGYEASELILVDAQHPANKVDWVIYTFIAKGLKKVADLNLDAGEKIKFKLVTFNELIEFGTNEKFIEKIMKFKLLEAKLSPEKKEALRKLFSPKN